MVSCDHYKDPSFATLCCDTLAAMHYAYAVNLQLL